MICKPTSFGLKIRDFTSQTWELSLFFHGDLIGVQWVLVTKLITLVSKPPK